jgi:hypothetical protein
MKLATILYFSENEARIIIDEGKNYKLVEVRREKEPLTKFIWKKKDFRDYFHFANVYAKFEEYCWFPKEPTPLKDLSYESIKEAWDAEPSYHFVM